MDYLVGCEDKLTRFSTCRFLVQNPVLGGFQINFMLELFALILHTYIKRKVLKAHVRTCTCNYSLLAQSMCGV